MGTEAGLMLVIDPTGAIAAFGRFNRAVDTATSHVDDFASRVKRDFEFVGNAAGLILKPLTTLIGVAAAAKASMLALGAASIGAAGDYEMFRRQLETVIKTKAAADQAFEESRTFAAATPFETDEIIRTRIELEAVGVRGSKAVKSVAEAAAAMNRNILDVSRAVKSMEVEPIRNLGIMMDELYSRGIDENFRNTTESFRKAQDELLEIFEEKFGGGVARMAITYKGLTSTLRGEITELRAAFGEGLLETAKLFVNDLIGGIGEFKETARLAGVEFGKELANARVNLLAGFSVALEIAKEIGIAMQQDGGVGTVILEALKLGAKILGEGILVAFEASISLWKVIGTTIGEGVLQAVYQSNIPGSGIARDWAINRNLENMPLSELQQSANNLGIKSIFRGQEVIPGSEEIGRNGEVWGPAQYRDVIRTKTREQLIQEMLPLIGEMDIPGQARYAQSEGVAQRNVTKSIESAMGKLQSGSEQWVDVTLTSIQGFANKIGEITGRAPVDVQARFKEFVDKYEQLTVTTLANWEKTLNPPGEGPGELEFQASDLGTGGAEWLAQVQRRAKSYSAVSGIGAEYTEDLQFELNAIGKTSEEQEKLTILRQADLRAKQEQHQQGLEEIGLIKEQRDEIGKLIDELHRAEKMQRIGDEIGNGFASGFSQATLHAKNLSDALDYLGDAAMGVIERIMEIQIWEPMAQSISRGFTSMTKPRASGGNVYPGEWYMTGEMGPELVRFDRPGTVLPHHQTMAQAGASNSAPQVYVNVNNQSQAQLDVSKQDIRFDGRRIYVDMVARDKRNNGPASQMNRRS